MAAGAVSLSAVAAQAATITVNSLADNTTGGDAQCTLREALANSNANAQTTSGDCVAGSGSDTINLTGLAGTITLGAQLSISDSTQLTGPGAATLAIDGANNSRVFYIYNNASALDVTISGLTLTRGKASTGGNVSNKGENVTLTSVTVSQGSATSPGGGIFAAGGALTLQSSTVSGNSSTGAGGGGGGIYVTNTLLTINNSTITGNSVSSLAARGGGISINSPAQVVNVTNSVISNNSSAGKAGALAVKNGTAALTIDHSTISGNTASGRGGAFFLYRTAGAITLSNDQITTNNTSNRGGGIFLYNAFANVTISDTTISGNTAPSASGNGGGIFFYKASTGVVVSVERSTISGNSTSRSGGGIFFYKGSGELKIEDSTISGNQAGLNGGGIFDRGPFGGTAKLTIRNSTLSGNSASTGGGNLNVTVVPTTITNSVVANGTAPVGPDMTTGGANVIANFSLIENTSGATFTGANNITAVDPNLGPLQDNGGPTFTQRPATGSPLIDAGDPAFVPPPATDQRGLARVFNGRLDIGALEQGAQSSIALSAAGASVAESAGSVTLSVNRTSGEGTASVNYSTSNATAQAGADYTASSGTVSWASGDFAPKTFAVPILEDAIKEPSEFFNVQLSVPDNATLGSPSSATVTITDNDPTPSITIAGVSAAEGNSGTTPFNFTVSLSNPSSSTITVNYATVNGAAIAGSDFTAQSGTLTFAPGVTTIALPISVLGDVVNEANETFTVVLSAPSNATIGSSSATGTIGNDDAVPSLSIGNVTLAEGNSGTTNFVFPVTLSAASQQTITVNYATATGSAASGSDFASTGGTLTFAPGVTSQNVTVLVNGDTTNEADETFSVNLSAASNATIAAGTGTGTIANDDSVVALSIGDVAQAEGTGGTTNFTFPVTLSAPSGQSVTVNYATSDGTALAGSDYTAGSGTLTFAPGVTSQSVTVAVSGDATSEPNETFVVTLSSATQATLADATANGTINDDDGAPTLSIAGDSEAEGNSGTTNFAFPVTLSAPSGQTVTVNYATANGSALAGSDYGATSGTLTFAPGVTLQTINVPVTGDVTNETNETFTVTLSAPSNATVGTGVAAGTIVNDDSTPSLSIGNASRAEGNSGTANLDFTVTLSAPSEQTVTVNYATASGSAIAGSDFTASSGVVTFAPGQTLQTISVPILGDGANENDETFTVVLGTPANASIANNTGTGTIVNDDPLPGVSIGSVSQAEGSSGTTNFTFAVTLSAASDKTITVSYATSDGSAIAGTDYTATSGTLTFAPGVTSQTITVPVSGDTTSEPAETFNVTLSSPVNATVGTAVGTGTIADDDSAPVLAVNNVSAAEGNTGTTTFTFDVTLSAPSGQTVTVNYATSNGSAVAGSDYGATSGTLTFAPGVTLQTISVPVTGDATNESDETFTVTLSSSSNAAIATATGTGTIVNDDAGPSLTIADASQAEGNSGSTNLQFVTMLSAPSEQTVTVSYATANGTAVAGSDYTAASGVLTFAPGVTVQSLDVPILGDTTSEPDETFAVVLSAASNAAIADASASGTIVNDDSGPALSVGSVSQAEGTGGTSNFTFPVTLAAPSEQTVTVHYETANGSALSGSDYVATSGDLTFLPGVTSQSVTVPVFGDATSEPNESFTVTLSAPVNATLDAAVGTGTIVDDDSSPVLTIGSVSQAEGNSGTTIFTFTVQLSAPSGQTVTVNYATANGSAIAGSDYGATSGTLTFAPGVTAQTIQVPVTGDLSSESDESFTVTLSSSSNAPIATPSGTGTIVNDDGFPGLSINDAAQAEGNSGATNLPFAVTLSAPSEQTITVSYATVNGTATAGSDFTATSGILTFAPGVTVQSIAVPILGDTASEPDETFTVVLSAPSNAAILDSSATGTIQTDDAPYVPSITVNDVSVSEGDTATTAATFTLTLDAATTQPVTVDYATTAGSAQQGSDYLGAQGTIVFPAGTTTRTVTVEVLGDEDVEPNETFALDLSAPSGATLARSHGTATIVNDDSPSPTSRISISDVRVTEGNDGLTDAALTVTLSRRSDVEVTIDYATADGTAQSGSDYAISSGSIVFPAGATSRVIHVPVVGDTRVEGDENFFVRLSHANGASLSDGEGVVTITDDDVAQDARRGTIAIAGATPGAGGSFFETTLQLHNVSSAPASGVVIFHPVTGGAPAIVPYTLAANETLELEDAALRAGIGSADLVSTTGPVPLAVVRISTTSACGTVGLTTQSLDPSRDALIAPDRAVLLVPPDLGTSRFNIGIRAVDHEATLRLTLYDRAGTRKTSLDRTFAADTLLHTAAADVLGVAVAASDSIAIEVLTGSAIVYGATTDNSSQDPSLQLARPLR